VAEREQEKTNEAPVFVIIVLPPEKDQEKERELERVTLLTEHQRAEIEHLNDRLDRRICRECHREMTREDY
jgi:hypothetical protein